MIIASTNYKSIVLRLIVLAFLASIIFFVEKVITTEKADSVWILYLMCIILAFACFSIIIGLGGIIKIEFDEPLGQVTFTRFVSKKTIKNNEVEGYYYCYYNTNKGTTYGRVIKTFDGKLRELNPSNLKDLDIVDIYLKNNSIKSLEQRRSFYPFTSGL